MNQTIANTVTTTNAPSSLWGDGVHFLFQMVYLGVGLIVTWFSIKMIIQMFENIGRMKHGIRVHEPEGRFAIRRVFCRHKHCSIIRQRGFSGLFCTRCGKRQDVGQPELQR